MRTPRDFITLLGGAVAWPLAARAQQPGFLNYTSPDGFTERLRGFRQGLNGLAICRALSPISGQAA